MSCKNKSNNKLTMVINSVLASGLLLSVCVGAASANVLEEVTVTAQKREQNIQDVGISVTAFSGEQLKDLGISNTVEIIQQVPGLQFLTPNAGLVTFNLRGISQANFQDHLEAPVAIYINDAYVSSMNAINGQLFDVERVEVLRGPQGTLFGRNATGGLIHYVTRHADEDEINGYIEATVGDFDKRNVEGAVGGAITNGVRGRLAARWEEVDGYSESQVGSEDVHGAADGYTIRGALQFDLGESVLADLIVSHSEDDDVPAGSFVIQPATTDANGLGLPVAGAPSSDPFEDFSDVGSYERDTTSATLKFKWDLDNGMEVTSITNYMDLEKTYIEDADGTVSALSGVQFDFTTIADYEQWSQEIRLSGDSDRTRWQVGGYYLDIDANTPSITSGNLLLAPAFVTTLSEFEMESTNWSIFGQMEFDLTEQFTLIGGLRWSQDDKDIAFSSSNDYRNADGSDDGVAPLPYVSVDNGIYTNVNNPFGAPDTVLSIPGIDEIDYGDIAARIQLNYTPTDDALYFISYNRGIKGGNWSPGNDVSANNFKHGEEVLNSYEIGTKLTLMEGIARLNATLFYYDYNDYQQFSILNLTPQIVNEDASSHGGEIELYMTPKENLDIILGASVIDSEVDGAPAAFNPDVGEVELPNAPEYSFNGLVRYAWPALGGMMAVQVDGVYNGDQYLEVNNNALSEEDGYFVGNTNLSYTNKNWRVTAWMKNFTDEEYRIYHLDLGAFDAIFPGFGFTQEIYGSPRTYGLTANYSF